MTVTDSRVRQGVLKLTAGSGGTAKDFSCQVTAISIEPGVNEADPVEVLCGDKVGGGSTVNDTLNFTVISDHAAADGLIAFSWLHRGETVNFEFQPDNVAANKWSGTVVDQALTVGGAVGEQITVDASWQIVTVTPPTGFGDGQLHTGGGSTPSKASAAPGTVYPAEATVTASDAPNAAKLAGLGYTAAPTTAWTTGQKITIGSYDFNWSGTAWAAGAHA